MDEREFSSFSRRLPSPEELFHGDELFHTDKREERKPGREKIDNPEQGETLLEKAMESSRQREESPDREEQQGRDAGESQETEREQKAVETIAEEKEAEDMKEQVLEEEPASKRKKKKLFSAGFVIGLLVLALVITNLSFFHIHLFCMMSDSMGDTIPKGSVIISYEAPAEKLETGDVITYMNRDGVLITHEIVSVIADYDGNGGYAFRTKGTANVSEDDEAVTYGMVKGKALIYIPYIGKPFVK